MKLLVLIDVIVLIVVIMFYKKRIGQENISLKIENENLYLLLNKRNETIKKKNEIIKDLKEVVVKCPIQKEKK